MMASVEVHTTGSIRDFPGLWIIFQVGEPLQFHHNVLFAYTCCLKWAASGGKRYNQNIQSSSSVLCKGGLLQVIWFSILWSSVTCQGCRLDTRVDQLEKHTPITAWAVQCIADPWTMFSPKIGNYWEIQCTSQLNPFWLQQLSTHPEVKVDGATPQRHKALKVIIVSSAFQMVHVCTAILQPFDLSLLLQLMWLRHRYTSRTTQQPTYANWQRPGSKEMYIPSSWLRKDPHIPDISVIHFVVDSFEPLENGGTIHPPVDIDCTFLISSGLSWRAYNNLEGMLAGGGSTNMLDGTCTLSLL